MYKLTSSSNVFRAPDESTIPADPANTDYAQYLAWLAAGNTPDPYIAPPISLPTSVTMRQARLALLSAGLLTTVTNAITSMTGVAGDQARIVWEFSSEVTRDNAVLQALLPALGMTSDQVDELFLVASKL